MAQFGEGNTMALKSHICEILGIEYPILLAGMGGASIPALAAAVSNAGGLGVVIAYIFVTVSFLKYRLHNAGVKRPFKIRFWKIWGCLSLLLSLLLLLLYFPLSPNGLIWPYEWGIVFIWCSIGFFLFLSKERNG